MRALGLSELDQISGGLQSNGRSASLQRLSGRRGGNARGAGSIHPALAGPPPGTGIGVIGYGYGYVVDDNSWYGDIYGGGYETYSNGYDALPTPASSVGTIQTSSGYTAQATPTYDIANDDWAVGVEIQGPNLSATGIVDADLQGGQLDVQYQVPGTDITLDADLKMQGGHIAGAGMQFKVPFD